jgi:hypothetical protein
MLATQSDFFLIRPPPNINQQSDTARFSKITEMKRGPADEYNTARRASWEEQRIPKGAGILGDMWNK